MGTCFNHHSVHSQKKRFAAIADKRNCSFNFFSHLFKDFLLPNEPRPMRAITDGSYIHTVPGVQIDYLSSFPSGHTTTIFCFYLLFCLLIKKNWWLIWGLVFALLVGYSRIYLAEHFPFDVAGGMIAAIISIVLSVKIQRWGWGKCWLKATGKN